MTVLLQLVLYYVCQKVFYPYIIKPEVIIEFASSKNNGQKEIRVGSPLKKRD